MQRLFLLLTVIISRAVASPIAQSYPDDSFDIALSDFNNPGIAAPEPFQIAEIGKPSQAPAQTPQAPDVAQPGDPVLRQKPQPKPQIPSQVPGGDNPGEQKATNQPFDCGPGKSGACCVGGTRDGVTAGCIRCTSCDMNRTLPWRWWIITHIYTHTRKQASLWKKESGGLFFWTCWADSYYDFLFLENSRGLRRLVSKIGMVQMLQKSAGEGFADWERLSSGRSHQTGLRGPEGNRVGTPAELGQ